MCFVFMFQPEQVGSAPLHTQPNDVYLSASPIAVTSAVGVHPCPLACYFVVL